MSRSRARRARARIRAFLIGAALVAAPATVFAQHGVEAHEGAHAVEDGEPGGHGAAAAEHGAHGGGHGDPSKHFNFFDIGYGKKDVYGGKKGDGVQGPNDEPEEPMSPPFAFALINFGILLVILAKYGGPAARKMAETRSDQIKGALDEAAKLRQAAAAKLDEYSSLLTAAEAEMKTMLDNMRADAAAEKERILAAAEAQAKAMQRDAEQRIAAEIALARATLTREIAIAASNAAESIIKSKATPADHTKLVDTFVADVGRRSAGPGAV
jgi:F-type H+-transporting ATPase subunit b